MTIKITDNIPKPNITGNLSGYKNFIENSIANHSNSNITLNLSNFTGATNLTEVKITIDKDYIYTNNKTSGEMFFTANGGTNATNYDINITILKTRTNMTALTFNASGDMNVSMRYTDNNGTDTEIGTVNSNAANTMTVNYNDGSSATFTIGLKNGNRGSLWIKLTNSNGTTSFAVTVPKLNETKKLGYEYDATLNYTQGPVNIVRRIGR
ncbi:hypothetical protein HZC07_04090 [Candidatus Micrarchaeota archaeon]|nr:hypothetical protein [Candidatus Micrarchaeota archaeon]